MVRLALDGKPRTAWPLSPLGNSMTDFTCRFHQILEPDTLEDLLVRMYCDDCNAPLNELIPEGQALEVCAEEHYSNPSTGERFFGRRNAMPELSPRKTSERKYGVRPL